MSGKSRAERTNMTKKIIRASAKKRATRRKPPRPRKAVIRPYEMPVIIRTELRTGSGVKTLSVKRSTELRHVRYWPDGRRELLPRAYTSAQVCTCVVEWRTRRSI